MTEERPSSIYGRRLREARESYGYSQADLAAAIGLDVDALAPSVSRYENGHHQPKLSLQQMFAKALELPLSYFYTEDDEEAREIANSSRSDKPVQRLAEIRKNKHT